MKFELIVATAESHFLNVSGNREDSQKYIRIHNLIQKPAQLKRKSTSSTAELKKYKRDKK